MRKILLTAAILISSSAIFAQTRFGVKAGVNLASMSFKEEGSSVTYNPSWRTTFNFGALADIPLNQTLTFQPGISISGKGFEMEESGEFMGVNFKEELNFDFLYLEVPLNAVAKLNAGPGKFLLGAGPYVGYGLSGNYKSTTRYRDDGGNLVSDSQEGDIEFGNGEEDMKALDFGLNFLTGYELQNGLNLNVGYGLGLSNLAVDGSGSSAKHKVFSVSLGFLF